MLKRAVGETLGVTYRVARRIVVAVVGATVVLVGVAMIVLPGPATLVIPLGLAILGLEFAWARRWLRAVRDRGRRLLRRDDAVGGRGEGAVDRGEDRSPRPE